MHRAVLQYTTGIYLARHTRCVRFNVETSLPHPIVLQLKFCYSYDNEVWTEVTGCASTATVTDGRACFVVHFGSGGSHVSEGSVFFPRKSADSMELPTLSYTVTKLNGECILEGRLKLHSTWRTLVHDDAVALFETLSGGADFAPTSAVYDALRRRWDELFEFIANRHRYETDMCTVHVYPEGQEPLPFNELLFLDFVRAACYEDDVPAELPSLITRRTFCGEVGGEGSSIMYLFHNLADLVGRSEFVRSLYRANRIMVISKGDATDLRLMFEADMPSFACTLRLPRSRVYEPSLVMELYTISTDEKASRIGPVPYITAGQLERANGDPFLAFSRLQGSTHHAMLSKMSLDHLLRPARTAITSYDLYKPTPIVLHSRVRDAGWWSTDN